MENRSEAPALAPKTTIEVAIFPIAGVVELADALDSKSSMGNHVGVRVPPPAPAKDDLVAALVPETARTPVPLCIDTFISFAFNSFCLLLSFRRTHAPKTRESELSRHSLAAWQLLGPP